MNIKEVNQRGFTLIEIIVTLILVGITAAMAGMWIASVANGYIFTKMNMETTQKAQLAMTRLEKEFKTISAVTASSATAITYTKTNYDYVNNQPLASLTGQKVEFPLGSKELKLNTNKLTDNVADFTLAYCDEVTSTSCSAVWSSTSRIIEITLTMTGASGVQSKFTQRVAPRNL